MISAAGFKCAASMYAGKEAIDIVADTGNSQVSYLVIFKDGSICVAREDHVYSKNKFPVKSAIWQYPRGYMIGDDRVELWEVTPREGETPSSWDHVHLLQGHVKKLAVLPASKQESVVFAITGPVALLPHRELNNTPGAAS